MKEFVHLGVNWRGYYRPQGPKSPSELENDKRLVEQILKKMGYAHIIKPDANFYDFRLEKTDSALKILLEELAQRSDLISPFIGVDKKYTHRELELAELLLWRATNQAIEDDYYDPYTGRSQEIHPYIRQCETCRTPLEQVRPLIVNKQLMGKRDTSFTYHFETILTESVGRLLRDASINGLELLPVQYHTERYKDDPKLYQLKVTNTLPEMASPPTKFEQFQHCDICGKTSRYIKHTHYWGKIQYYENTDIYYARSVLKQVKDFNYTAEFFGDLPTMHPEIIITQRVYKLFREHKIKDWEVVPVYLID